MGRATPFQQRWEQELKHTVNAQKAREAEVRLSNPRQEPNNTVTVDPVLTDIKLHPDTPVEVFATIFQQEGLVSAVEFSAAEIQGRVSLAFYWNGDRVGDVPVAAGRTKLPVPVVTAKAGDRALVVAESPDEGRIIAPRLSYAFRPSAP